MMTRFSLLFTTSILLIAGFTSCKKVVGTGPQVSSIRTLDAFNSISLAMDATVNITQDSFYKVEVIAQNNIMDAILTKVNDGRLTIQHKNNVYIKSAPISVNITMPNINNLNLSGSGTIQVQNQLVNNSLETNVSGSGKIIIPSIETMNITSTISGSGAITIHSGSTHQLISNISGSGEIDLLNVQANTANTTTSGSGDTKVYATQSLYAKISGSGDVYYRGNPSIESNISGSGRLIKQ